MKRVKVSLDLSESFVRLLQARVQLAGWLQGNIELDPVGVLAVAILGEARGALPQQVEAKIPAMWKDDLRVVHQERVVEFLAEPKMKPGELTHVGGTMLPNEPRRKGPRE